MSDRFEESMEDLAYDEAEGSAEGYEAARAIVAREQPHCLASFLEHAAKMGLGSHD